MQGIEQRPSGEGGDASPTEAEPAPPNAAALEESDQRATPEGIDASPRHPQASAEPGQTTTPATGATPAPAAEPFCTGNLVLLDGTEPAVVAYRRKKGGQWTYMLKTTTQGMQLVTGDRVTAAVEGVAA